MPTTASSERVIDVHSLSTRDLADALVAAFSAGERVALSGQDWKRPSVEAVLGAVAAATGVQGEWEWRSVATPIALPAPPLEGPRVQSEPLGLALAPGPPQPSGQWLEPQDVAAEPACEQHGTGETPEADGPQEGSTAPQGQPAAEGAWNDWDWAATGTAPVSEEPVETDAPEDDTFGQYETYQPEIEQPAVDDFTPEPPREPLPPVEGDVLANAAYALIAFQQPVMMMNLKPRPTTSVSVSTPAMIDGNPMEILRELAALDEL